MQQSEYHRFSMRYLELLSLFTRQVDTIQHNLYTLELDRLDNLNASRNYTSFRGPMYNRNTTSNTPRTRSRTGNRTYSPQNYADNTYTSPSVQARSFTVPITGTNNPLSWFWDSVPIYPTQAEINQATSIVPYSELENQETTERQLTCPITMEQFSENMEIIKINHCGHCFKKDALLRWFRNHVSCPVCRHDIREIPNNNNSNSNENSNDDNNTTTATMQFDFIIDRLQEQIRNNSTHNT